MHDENGGNGDDNGDSVTSVSDAGSATATPPLQISQMKQHGSVDDGLVGDNNSAASVTTSSTTANAANVNTTTATPTASIPLGENTLLVDISDALSEKDKVKFTVHTRTTFPTYAKKDFFVVRQHEEFIWLHDRYEENENYAGYIVSQLMMMSSARPLNMRSIYNKIAFDVCCCSDSTMSATTRFRCIT